MMCRRVKIRKHLAILKDPREFIHITLDTGRRWNEVRCLRNALFCVPVYIKYFVVCFSELCLPIMFIYTCNSETSYVLILALEVHVDISTLPLLLTNSCIKFPPCLHTPCKTVILNWRDVFYWWRVRGRLNGNWGIKNKRSHLGFERNLTS